MYTTIAIRARSEFDPNSIRHAATRYEDDSSIHITTIKQYCGQPAVIMTSFNARRWHAVRLISHTSKLLSAHFVELFSYRAESCSNASRIVLTSSWNRTRIELESQLLYRLYRLTLLPNKRKKFSRRANNTRPGHSRSVSKS